MRDFVKAEAAENVSVMFPENPTVSCDSRWREGNTLQLFIESEEELGNGQSQSRMGLGVH